MNEQEAINLLKEEKAPDTLLRHSITVSEVSLILAFALKENGYEIDLELVKVGGLLHDIGRTRMHTVHHGYVGGKLLREMGIDERIVRIAERHVGGGLSKEDAEKINLPEGVYMPETLEEKVVCFADKIVGMDRVIPLEETLDKFRKELGDESDAVQRLIELKGELAKLLGRDPEDEVKQNFFV
ncbi:MAG: HDIG domain-containing protein [Candidatus Methylarchaceae archaeon HK01B]|nr:HDIG domain-containing protein [Candidatus Methylarchaceae archaeon HK01B]